MIGELKFFDKKVLKTKKVGEPTLILVYSTFAQYITIPWVVQSRTNIFHGFLFYSVPNFFVFAQI